MPRPKYPFPENMPYVVSPYDLEALGVDPDIYIRALGPTVVGWALDRKKDAALIQRLPSKRESHETVQ